MPKNANIFVLFVSTLLILASGCEQKNRRELLQSGIKAARVGKWEEALQFADDCLDLTEEDTKARVLKGICLEELRRGEKARKILKKAAKGAEASFEAQFFYGWVLCEHGEYGKALEPLERAHAIKSGHLDTLVLLSRCALEQNLPEKGRRYLQPLRRFEAFEDSPALYNSLGLLNWKQQNYDEAQRNFRQAFKLDKSNPTVLQNLAVYWDRLGNFRKALHYYRLCKSASQEIGDVQRAAAVTERLREMMKRRDNWSGD